MPDGKRLPFDEIQQFVLATRGEELLAMPIAKRHICGGVGSPDRPGDPPPEREAPSEDDVL